MAILKWLRDLFRTIPSTAPLPKGVQSISGQFISPPTPEQLASGSLKPVWSVVANVVHERAYGPGGVEKRHGTKHFAPGAKVYVIYFHWGTAGERVTVAGHHRKSGRYIYINIAAKALANWRAELVYSPYVIRQTWEHGEMVRFGPESDLARQRAEEIVVGYTTRGAKTQPYVERLRSSD
jgi:hypothetical protein